MHRLLSNIDLNLRSKMTQLLLGAFILLLGLGLVLLISLTSERSLFPFLISVLLYSSVVYFEERWQRTIVQQLSIISLVGSVVLFFDLNHWLAIGIMNFIAVLYFIFFLCPLNFEQVKCKIKIEFIVFLSIFFGLNILLFNLEYLVSVFGRDLYFNDLLFSYLHLLLELSAIILSLITGGFILYTVIHSHHLSDVPETKGMEKQVEFQGVLLTKEKGGIVSEYVIAEKIVSFFESSDDYLQSTFSAKQLSSEIGLENQRQLSVIVQHFFHLTFNELLAKYRIAHALNLLRNEQNWSIVSVAESSGFRSFTTFNKYFVHFVGMKASDYKDRNIKID
ncbi:helix-turn-helix domain-containing protein [Myroides sp. BIT-d1]|uniref:Helix-turn-helix domain-containing protein n=1 Tax=Myroides albus TaxID=2562892 RepID=A0A6I3LTR4_9FLAO|nr:helix-turn-helix domain-containing protein [Myroides albus]MTG99365.1 helix-turn-helix domain-containing protein [Myroides albus]